MWANLIMIADGKEQQGGVLEPEGAIGVLRDRAFEEIPFTQTVYSSDDENQGELRE